MRNYRITNIDERIWRDFKTLAASEGKSIREKFLDYILEQALTLRAEKKKQKTFIDTFKIEGEKV